MSDQDPRSMQAQLEAPFDPMEVDFRPADRGNQVVAFIDGEAVIRRLNTVFGPNGWAFDYDPLVISPGAARSRTGEPPPHDVVWVAKGRLMIGTALHADIGDADANETSKAAVTDALKRCATQVGIGLYLRSLPRMTAKIVDYAIPDDEKARLRKLLPRPGNVPAQAQNLIQSESGVPSQGAQHSNGSQGSTARPTGNEGQGAEPRATLDQLNVLRGLVAALGWGESDRLDYLHKYHATAFSHLAQAQAATCITDLQQQAQRVQGAAS